MIVLTGAFASVVDPSCIVNPLHIACVGGVATAPWLDTPEAQQQFDNIQNAYPGARAEITFSNGRSVFVLETPTEVYEKIKEWSEKGMLTARDVSEPLP